VAQLFAGEMRAGGDGLTKATHLLCARFAFYRTKETSKPKERSSGENVSLKVWWLPSPTNEVAILKTRLETFPTVEWTMLDVRLVAGLPSDCSKAPW